MSESFNANPEAGIDATAEIVVPESAADVTPETAAATPETEAEETVTGVPVLAQAHPVQSAHAALPAVQAAAVAATGFVAGAATLALVRRHSARKLARSRGVSRRAVDMLPIVGSRTFIVDVHMLAKPGE